MVKRFKLGVVTDPSPEHTQFLGRISIPYINAKGIHYISFRCPCITKECPNCADGRFKYMATDGEYRPLYNSWLLDRDLDKIYASEGELNAGVSTYVGMPCIGTGSATRFEPHWSHLFDGLEEIVLLQDGDGNDEAPKKMVKLWRRYLPKETRVGLRVVKFPSGLDVANFHKKYGPDALVDYVAGAP